MACLGRHGGLPQRAAGGFLRRYLLKSCSPAEVGRRQARGTGWPRGWKWSQVLLAQVKRGLAAGVLPSGGLLSSLKQRPQVGLSIQVRAGEKWSQVLHSRSLATFAPSESVRFLPRSLVLVEVPAKVVRAPAVVINWGDSAGLMLIKKMAKI